MTARYAPVTMGSPEFRNVVATSVEVVSAWFPPNADLHTHAHSRAVFGLMLDGAFKTSILGRNVDYESGSAWSEPAEERHANIAGTKGARVLVIQPANGERALPALHGNLFDEIVHRHALDLLPDAARLEAECHRPDDLSPLVVEGVALALLASGARLFRQTSHHGRAPRWLLQVVDYLQSRFLERVVLGDVAREVGVHPSQLAHEFRLRMRTSPGEYLRRLRVEWAARQLRDRSTSLADVAVRAGFHDQSHFTRVFRRYYGMAPDAWRRAR